MIIRFPYYNPVKKACTKWVESNDEPLSEAVTNGENDPFLTLLTIARLFRFTKTYKACMERLEICGYLIPKEVRMKDNNYKLQRKRRFIEEAIEDEWLNYYVTGRLVRVGHVPTQRNLTFLERDDLIKLLEANKDIRGYESIVAKLIPEPVKGGLRKKDLNANRR